ncbi:carbon-nitrogen hydrolase family protein (plasmid) [Arthrobacter sp. D3-18]
MIAAVGQFEAGTDVSANLEACIELVDQAAARGAELVVLPELSMYFTTDSGDIFSAVAEPLDGKFVSTLGKRAAKHRMHVIAGVFESNPEGLPYNSIVSLEPTGKVMGTNHKTHLCDAFGIRESDAITPGTTSQPFVEKMGELSVGSFVCYDLRFPESGRRLLDAGAEVMAVPAAWISGFGKEDQFATLIKARAIENVSYVLAANQTGPFRSGYSMIVDPFGVVLASAGEGFGVATAEISAARLNAVRGKVPALQHRRFDIVPTAAAAASLA